MAGFRMKSLAVLVGMVALPAAAIAENCRALPAGPERRACAMRNPAFAAKFEHCRQLAIERGFNKAQGPKEHTYVRKDFVRDCMHGRQN
jgi:hypothetical protein